MILKKLNRIYVKYQTKDPNSGQFKKNDDVFCKFLIGF